jgi:hypothetical protein
MMGLEYRIETYDVDRTEIEDHAERFPGYLRTDDLGIHFTSDGCEPMVTMNRDGEYLILVQHVACPAADALLGLVVRKLLTYNDHVVISEL